MAEKKGKSEIMEIRDVLKTEFQRFASINTVLKETSDGFNQIDNTYSTYGSEMDTAKNHIIKLKRREFFENMFIYIGLAIYFSCVAYVLLKRFPIHRIVYLIYYILESIVGWSYSAGGNLMDIVTNYQNVNVTINISEADYVNFTSDILNKSITDL